MSFHKLAAVLFSVFAAAGAGCVSDGEDGSQGAQGPAGPAGEAGADGAKGDQGVPGPKLAPPAVYTLANAAAANEVTSYLRASNGNLSRAGRYGTGGAGMGAGIGSQGSLVFDAGTQRFFAVNPGDNSLSMMSIDADGKLTTLSKVASGGVQPVSVAVRNNLVYVANRGSFTGTLSAPNISGFRVQGATLVPIAGSTKALSATTDVRPTNIGFSPDGKYVLLIERLANRIDTFALTDGVAGNGNFQVSAGMQPFAFDFSPEGHLIVAEVGNGTATGSTASSYSISASGTLTPITSALPTLQGAACWIAVAGGYAYIANAATANLTGLVIGDNGSLTLRDASGVTATTGAGAIDLAVAPDRGYLYSLAGNPRAIHTFSISADGGLTALAPLPNVPATAVGLVAR